MILRYHISTMIIGILNDKRGWSTVENKAFKIVDREYSDLNIVFANKAMVDFMSLSFVIISL